jgi:hypothetical protein
MARQPSKVLSAAEKKTATAGLKADLKAAKETLKQHTRFKKGKEKLHAATIKQTDKDIAAAQKVVDGLTAQIEALAA